MAATGYIPNNVASQILKSLSFDESYGLASDLELFEDIGADIAEDFIWYTEASSAAKDDLPKTFVRKFNYDYLPNNVFFKVEVMTPILTTLPDGFDHKSKKLHKANVWRDLYNAGCVGSYWVRLISNFKTTMESFNVVYDIICNSPEEKFRVEQEALGYDGTGRLIIDGLRICDVDDKQLDYYIEPQMSKGLYTEPDYEACSLITSYFEEGARIRESTNRMGLRSTDYNIGMSKNQLMAFLN